MEYFISFGVLVFLALIFLTFNAFVSEVLELEFWESIIPTGVILFLMMGLVELVKRILFDSSLLSNF